ncbi:MAG TPA: VWA domain-containing protein, partial [Opitutales bacterium]|nr:VWA domain-containing protein [Opitutales bacterium]
DGVATASVPYQLERDGKVVAKGTANFENGLARVRLTDRIDKAGAVHYVTRLLPENDPVPGNNAAETWVEAISAPRVLIVSAYPDDPVAAALQAQGVHVDLETDMHNLSAGRLSGARGVILDNVPASDVPVDFLKAIAFFVNDQGGGLLMLGGKNSFGSGGYYKSPIDDLLPVSLELRDEKRKLMVAMAIVLDRSGSMRASVPSSGGSKQKIELADAGTIGAITQLGPKDLVSVFAVDTQAYPIVSLSTTDPDRQGKINNVAGIASQGGGIVVPVGLRAAWAELQKSDVGQKHIILFADANDALQQNEGTFDIVKQIADANCTITCIGLGQDTDSGADFLRQIAAAGNGRIFFCSDANDLVDIFTQDTVAVARSSFLTQVTPLKGSTGWMEIAAKNLDWLDSIDAFNMCYLKPKATQAALTGDADASPLVAFWQHESGRAAAITFPLAGPHSENIRAWPGYSDLVTSVTRWLMGTEAPDGLGVRAKLDGDQMVLDLLYDQKLDAELAKNFPKAIYTQNGPNTDQAPDNVQNITWERLEPGHFQAHVRLKPGQPAIGAVQVGDYSLPFGPLAPGLDLEWLRDPAGPRSLRALVAASGGREITELPEAWRDLGRQYYRTLRPWILIALVLAVLAEALATRIGVLKGWWPKKEKSAKKAA